MKVEDIVTWGPSQVKTALAQIHLEGGHIVYCIEDEPTITAFIEDTLSGG